MNINVTVDTSEVIKNVDRIVAKKIPGAVVKGINRAGYDVRDGLKEELPRHLDRPTPFTLNAFNLKRASIRAKTATIFIKRIQQQYLKWQISGGTSTAPKVVPGRTWNLNAYGNLTRGATKQANVYTSPLKGRRAYWKRRGGAKSRTLQLIGFIPKSRTYRKRFPFFTIGFNLATRFVDKKIRREVAKVVKL